MIYSEQNTETLVSLTLLGNEKAYEALVIRYQKAVIGAAYSVMGNRYMAEDAAQDAFVSAWMKLNMLREPELFGAWVCRIAKNCAKNIAVRYREYISFDLLENMELERDEFTEEFFIQDDESDRLHESINSLSQKVKQVIMLHYFEGLSVAEIADRLRVPVGTIKWRLHDGRQKIRKDFGYMEEKDTDTLAEKVMKKVEQLKQWRLRNGKDGFEAAYNETLRDVESLPECENKYHAMADVLMCGYWWLPGKKNDELIIRLREAAEKGNNQDVIEELITSEDNKLSGKEKIAFMRDSQIPRLEAAGYTKALGKEWFWLGHEYFGYNDRESGLAAYNKVLEILKPSDIYYANAISAIKAEMVAENCELSMVGASALAESYKFIDGKLRFWNQSGYGRGSLPGITDTDCIGSYSSVCDYIFYDTCMKLGDIIISSDGKTTLTFAEKGVCANTSCGVFDDCEMWVTKKIYETYSVYYKRGVGIVRLERDVSGSLDIRTLKAYKITGGDGLIPFAPGNRWEYEASLDSSCFNHENIFEVTSFDGKEAILWNYHFTRRNRWNEDSWDDMMRQIRFGYCKNKDDGSEDEILMDVTEQMTRAEALAQTPWQIYHTKVSCSVMRRILSTNIEFTPDCRIKGHWNFFELNNVILSDGKIMINRDSTYSFESKDMKKTGDSGYPMLFNDVYGILMDSTGCIWSEEWFSGVVLTKYVDCYYNADTKTEIRVTEAGRIFTAAGKFENCILVSLNIESDVGPGLYYRLGRKEYYFAPGIGIVRTVSHYKNDTLEAIYELTSYTGTGEGYMPVNDGMVRHYDAIGLNDGFVSAAEFTYCNDDNGALKILQDRTGIQYLQMEQ